MRSLVVLFALVAVSVAAPYGGQLVAYQQQAPLTYLVPGAVSHQSRVDHISQPVQVVAPEQVYAGSPVVPAGLQVAPTFYANNPFFYPGAPVATNYYGNPSLLSPFAPQGTVFAL